MQTNTVRHLTTVLVELEVDKRQIILDPGKSNVANDLTQKNNYIHIMVGKWIGFVLFLASRSKAYTLKHCTKGKTPCAPASDPIHFLPT